MNVNEFEAHGLSLARGKVTSSRGSSSPDSAAQPGLLPSPAPPPQSAAPTSPSLLVLTQDAATQMPNGIFHRAFE